MACGAVKAPAPSVQGCAYCAAVLFRMESPLSFALPSGLPGKKAVLRAAACGPEGCLG